VHTPEFHAFYSTNDTFRYRILSRRIAKVAFLSSIAKFLNRRKFFALNSIKAKLSLTPADDPTGDYFPSNDAPVIVVAAAVAANVHRRWSSRNFSKILLPRRFLPLYVTM